MDDLKRALGFISSIENACADRIEPFEWGVALFNEAFPRVYDFNFLRVEGTPRDLTFDELLEEVERLQAPAGLTHRKVVFEDEMAGRGFLPQFDALEWDPAALVVMVYRGSKDLAPAGDNVREISPDELRGVRATSLGATKVALDAEAQRQLLDKDHVYVERANARYFGALVDERAVCSADFYSDGSTAQIESVLTLQPYRKRGFGSAVVNAALAHALDTGHDLVFLIADDDDWPKEMYARMGFEPVGLCWDFTLTGV